jgi:hypothetical protein
LTWLIIQPPVPVRRCEVEDQRALRWKQHQGLLANNAFEIKVPLMSLLPLIAPEPDPNGASFATLDPTCPCDGASHSPTIKQAKFKTYILHEGYSNVHNVFDANS